MSDDKTAADESAEPPASASTNKSATLPQTGSTLLGRPLHLIKGENPRDFQELQMAISSTVKPGDIIEQILQNDFVELVWDSMRLRRLKAHLLSATLVKGLQAILESHWGGEQMNHLARQWAMGEQSAVERVDEILWGAGMTIDAAMAQALAINIDVFERIDTMILKNEARRNAVLGEIELHRVTVGPQLRKVVQQVEDAEFAVLEPDQVTIGSAT